MKSMLTFKGYREIIALGENASEDFSENQNMKYNTIWVLQKQKHHSFHTTVRGTLFCFDVLRSWILVFISLCFKGTISWDQTCRVLIEREVSSTQSPKNNANTFP